MLQHTNILYGPVKSRRLGVSLGVNLMPVDAKICSFNCVYCECGFNTGKMRADLPKRIDFYLQMESRLKKMSALNEPLNTITFAGNGEPTMHPRFLEIINDTIELRDKYYPQATISVLTNATQIHRRKVFEALQKVENPILKLDSVIEHTMRIMDRPVRNSVRISWLIEQMSRFDGNFIMQTMFLQGSFEGQYFDNTTDLEVEAWLNMLRELHPRQVMIYTIDRETPIYTLQKIPLEKLEEIAQKVREIGIDVSIAG
jgi:wyosine [tRNA(Phe)-imidazoG37] synthetase (radical SAM superfamily)